MSGLGVKFESVTPDRRKSPNGESSFLTSVGETGEVLDDTGGCGHVLGTVCDTLGISPSELYPKTISDFSTNGSRLTSATRFQHYEQLRKAKLEVLNQELARRRLTKASPRSQRPALPVSGVGMWRQRFNYVCSRIETVRRVLDNQSRLKSKQRESLEGRLRAKSARERRVYEDRKAQDKANREKAREMQRRRDKVLREIKKVRVRQARETQELSALSQSPTNDRSSFSAGSTLRVSISGCTVRSHPREDKDDTSERLSRIQAKLAKGVQRAQAHKQAVSLTARSKSEQEEVRVGKKRKAEIAESKWRRERIHRLQQSSERHIRNKEVRLDEAVQRLNSSACLREKKVHKRIIAKDAETRAFEDRYMQKEAERSVHIDQHFQAKQRMSAEKAQRQEKRRENLQETRVLLSSLRMEQKERILQKMHRVDQAVGSINEVKSQLRVLQERAAAELRIEKEKRMAVDLRSDRSIAASLLAGNSKDSVR